MQAINQSRKKRFTLGFNAGLVAGIGATILMVIISVTLGGISLAEALGAAISQAMPLPVFEYLHKTIGDEAKHYLFYGILVGQCLIFALAGGLCNLLTGENWATKSEDHQGRIRFWVGALLAALLWLLTGLLFLPLTGAGLFGALLSIGIVNTMLSLAIVGLAFGLMFVFIQNWFVERQLNQAPVTIANQYLKRRAIIRNGLTILGVGIVGTIAWRFITGAGGSSFLAPSKLAQSYKSKITPPTPNYAPFPTIDNLSPEITSNDKFYTVSKNLFSDPIVNGTGWKLSIDGEVNHAYTLTYDQLMAIPRKQQYESLMCISNEVGGQYMSNALWEGIPLSDLLAKAGNVKPGATKVVLHAADDYADSIHLTKALEPTTMVAVKMNGETLPSNHGYPARLLVPGIYGMKHVKWITRIEIVNTDYKGYWQQNGWSDPAPIHMTSRIDTPFSGTTLTANKPTYIAGVAFSGNKGISQVDVSLDNGNTWQPSILQKPLSDLTWVLWELPWQPASGQHTIVVRAIDKEGNVQNPQGASPLPDGSSGYHTLSVTVA